MKIQCNSCSKTFLVPDNAITNLGRLVQCSSCGNKWTQYPIKLEKIDNTRSEISIPIKNTKKTKREVKEVKVKKIPKKIKKTSNPYSPEYLKKKHGLKIIDPSEMKIETKSKNVKIKNVGFSFYNYLIIFIVFLLTFFGLLNHTKDIVIGYFPFMDEQIYYLYETINNLKIIILDIFS